MEKEKFILNEFVKGLNWKERIVVKIHQKVFIKVFKNGITFGFNNK